MKTYKITITEKLEMTVEVEAPDRVSAQEIVEESWHNGDYILDAGHFTGVTFEVEAPHRERGGDR